MMHVLRRQRSWLLRVLGSWPAESLAIAVAGGSLRILAFHGIPNLEAFTLQMRHLAGHYRPLSGAAVVGALRGERRLPRKAVWITFDDGYPEVVSAGKAVLDELGLPATLFICPHHVGGTQPFWWEVVRRAVTAGLWNQGTADGDPPTVLARAKLLPDARRRALVRELTQRLAVAEGRPPASQHLDLQALHQWASSGREVGNHTWDHPCLDMCTPEEAANQIRRADEWLDERLPQPVKLFAYPNGNWAPAAESTLSELGYDVALLFDHRLARPGEPPLRLSRLRVSSDAGLDRFRAIVSGAHSALFHLTRRRGG